MAQINKPNEYFTSNLHTGTGSSQNITTGLNMSANGGLVWNKVRSTSNNHILCDTIRGATKLLFSDLSASEGTDATSLTSFNTDGWTGGGGGNTNGSGQTFVSWNWLAGGTPSSNTDGSITSNVSASTTSGFSVVSYTGNGTAGATIGHGLSSQLDVIFIKNRTDAEAWQTYHRPLGATHHLSLNATSSAQDNNTRFNDTHPTSSVFTLGNNDTVNKNTSNFVAYCFHSVKGFSKAFSYTGNGSSDGSFTYLGFRPAWVMIKKTSGTGNWCLFDNKRGVNGAMIQLNPDNTNADNTSDYIDFLSNGFKCRNTASDKNASGGSYIGIAFAENPLVSTAGVPCTAR